MPTRHFSLVPLSVRAPVVSPRAAQGFAVALAEDFLVVGSPWDDARNGSVLVYHKRNGTLAQKLTGADFGPDILLLPNKGVVGMGTSVALFNDDILAVGAPFERNDFGAVFVYKRSSASGLFEPLQRLRYADPWETEETYSENLMGYSLAVCASRLVVGAPGYAFARGLGVVYAWNGTAYEYEARLDADDGEWFSQRGLSVAVNRQGTLAVLGGPGDNYYTGATWIFTRKTTSTAWEQHQPKLVGTHMSAGRQGFAVSVNAAGTRALIGGPNNDENMGGAWVFEPNSKGHFVQKTYLFPWHSYAAFPLQGSAVALSPSGNVAVLGGPRDNSDVGAVSVFVRRGGVWYETNKLVPWPGRANPAPGYPQFGYSIALYGGGKGEDTVDSSADEHYELLIGGPYNSSLVGAAWYYGGRGGGA